MMDESKIDCFDYCSYLFLFFQIKLIKVINKSKMQYRYLRINGGKVLKLVLLL